MFKRGDTRTTGFFTFVICQITSKRLLKKNAQLTRRLRALRRAGCLLTIRTPNGRARSLSALARKQDSAHSSLLLVQEALHPLLEQLRLQAGVGAGVDAGHLDDLLGLRDLRLADGLVRVRVRVRVRLG